MESKRKSNGADAEDRASKRQRTAAPQNETTTSTTKVGLAFLEQIRRTGDKSGRRIATDFEELLPKDSNKDYYRVVRMPISLAIIERKLRNDEFENLSELESYVKRMVQNAKDFYPRSSHTYDDAERIRKATSNFMVKHNPAYKVVHGYSAVPTPIPDELLQDTPEASPEDAEEHDDEGDDTEEKPVEDAEEDAEKVETKEDEIAEEDKEKEGGDEDDEDDEDGDAAEDGDDSASHKQNSAQSSRDTSLRARRKSTIDRAVSSGVKPDHEYEGVPYKGLTFQQAQEKIVEEVIRRPDNDEDGYAYFEPFFNLPSRTLKDYFQLIKDPLSLKKLQKLVKGIKSRTERSGVTEFKSWTAFEEKASLLWENAYFYNEDGSPIAKMAKELEVMFRGEFKKAKEAVPEPPQPKIKIKVPVGQETLAPSSKKITIHVANASTRGGSADSSSAIPKISESDMTPKVTPKAAHTALEKTRSISAASRSPSTAAELAREDSISSAQQQANGVSSTALSSGASPAPTPLALAVPASTTSTGQVASTHSSKDAVAVAGAPPATLTPMPPPRPAHESKFRQPSHQPLMTNLSIRTHPAISTGDKAFELKLPPHPKLTQRSVTLNIPPGQWRQQMTVNFSEALQQQQRPYKFFVIANGATLGQGTPLQTPLAEEIGAKLFEVNLHPGVNVIQVQVIAGMCRGQKLPNGAEAELEKLTIFANLLRN